MAEDISGLGTSVRIIATSTFPRGFEITQFADDSDPIDVPSHTITENAMGLNGDLVKWSSANPIVATLNVITGSEDDVNLNLLFEANRAGRNKTSNRDTITMIITYPETLTTFTGGSCNGYMPSKAIASEGRFKTNGYIFGFENRFSV